MTFEEFKEAFIEWTINEIESKKEDGFPVCPYARKARVDNKIQFIDASEEVSNLRNFDQENFEIGIAWIGNTDYNVDTAMSLCEFYSQLNPDLLYFKSIPGSGYFTSNVSYCIFIQLKNDILEKRGQLLETKYYDSWPEEYFQEITGLDKKLT